ncbi:MFS transporter [Neiella marina]|uniref:MFS transporter n=1 Tax=Neiella holothuriorum TaxID=2870530 RepID=A0ABS7EB34_9GAMM|nr:MFS transporter [Neiella holothuriorum]MBW8189419.1 MFS transporter [Neiella holothuriorum]
MKIKGFRWVIIGLIFTATVINYIDRSALSIMWPTEAGIAHELGLDDSDYGLILNVFMVAYALGQLFSGKIFDKIGTRIGYVLAIGIWGLSSFMHSFARGFMSLAILRTTLGFSEAGNWPGAVKSNAEWFPVKERAVAQGLFNAGASIGAVIAPPLIAMLFAAFGWKITFMIVGSFGIVWIVPWLLINKAGPKEHPWVTDEERKYILDGQPAEAAGGDEEPGLTWGQLLRIRETYSILIGRFFLEPIWWFFVGWMPIYLAKVYGFNVKELGMFLWFPYVGAAIGSIAGGIYSGKIIAKSGDINKGRKSTVVIGSVLMFLGLVATVAVEHTAYSFMGVVFLVLFGFQFAIGNIQTLPGDFYSGKSVGSLAGMGGMVGVFSVIILNFLVPIIAEVSYTPIFILIGAFVPLGVLAVFFFGGTIGPVEKARIDKVRGV